MTAAALKAVAQTLFFTSVFLFIYFLNLFFLTAQCRAARADFNTGAAVCMLHELHGVQSHLSCAVSNGGFK